MLLFLNGGSLCRSAYVEFMRKEAAENALSLDGTSFMSRILKVHKHLSYACEKSSFSASLSNTNTI